MLKKLFKKKRIINRPTNPKISVIMPVYLGIYDGCADDRENRFMDAIGSFITQSYNNKELIIVSDGCDESEKIVKENFCYENIKFYKLPKQETFSGNVREYGLKHATGELICYLDSDDLLGQNHLSSLANSIDKDVDFVYYNDLIVNVIKGVPQHEPVPRNVNLEFGLVGTSTICHWKDLNRSWNNCNGYGHDWRFIKSMINDKLKYKKIYGAEYYVCHIPNFV